MTAPVTTAAWLSEPKKAPVRGVSNGPRALDARGLATMHHILVQLSQVGLRPRFAEVCRAFGDIVWCDDLDDLMVRSPAREALAIVVDVEDRHGDSSAAVVTRIRANRPGMPIVLWCDRETSADRIQGFLEAGVSAVVFREESELERRLLSNITRASDVAFQQMTDQALYRRVPTPFVPVFRYCLDHATSMPRADVVARSVGLSAKTLATQLRRAGMPPVSSLVMWSKALVAAYRLEKSNESVAAIARSLGFSSGSALRRLIRRCANETPHGLREPGGFGWALRCFERYLSKGRPR